MFIKKICCCLCQRIRHQLLCNLWTNGKRVTPLRRQLCNFIRTSNRRNKQSHLPGTLRGHVNNPLHGCNITHSILPSIPHPSKIRSHIMCSHRQRCNNLMYTIYRRKCHWHTVIHQSLCSLNSFHRNGHLDNNSGIQLCQIQRTRIHLRNSIPPCLQLKLLYIQFKRVPRQLPDRRQRAVHSTAFQQCWVCCTPIKHPRISPLFHLLNISTIKIQPHTWIILPLHKLIPIKHICRKLILILIFLLIFSKLFPIHGRPHHRQRLPSEAIRVPCATVYPSQNTTPRRYHVLLWSYQGRSM
mmetsp:Transcript_8160/g.16360  ORF Transcript_8160/g.16360 Transcript_8160/m.16360 type:complete len:298 (+) Transcript_8160:54-947(+)